MQSDIHESIQTPHSVQLSIIVPRFNEAHNIKRFLQEVLAVVHKVEPDYEMILSMTADRRYFRFITC